MDLQKSNALIVDDDPTIRSLFRILTESLGFANIAEAENGQEAIIKFNELLPSFILLDINMPIKTGDAVLEEIKHKMSKSCVIIVSQISEIDIVKKCIDLGAFYYIKKDVDFSKIQTLVQSAWKKFEKIQEQSNADTALLEKNVKDKIYQRVKEDKFCFTLLSRNLVDKKMLQELIEKFNNDFFAILLYMTEKHNDLKFELGWMWSMAMDCSYTNALECTVQNDLLSKIPREIAKQYGIMPLDENSHAVNIAFSLELEDSHKKVIAAKFNGKLINYIFSYPDDIETSINKYYQ